MNLRLKRHHAATNSKDVKFSTEILLVLPTAAFIRTAIRVYSVLPKLIPTSNSVGFPVRFRLQAGRLNFELRLLFKRLKDSV